MKRLPTIGLKKTNNKVIKPKRNKEEVSFYKSYRWRKTSESYRKANPLCVECKEKGITKQANVVDHIIPIKEGGYLYEWINLQSLCHKHHNIKTKKDVKKYGK